MGKERFWTIPNIISLSKIPLVLLFAVLLYYDVAILAFTFLLLAAATDFFDGYIARKLKQTSKMGETIDHISDKVSVLIVLITLFVVFKLPAYVFLLLTRDVISLFFGLLAYAVSKGKIMMKASIYGKLVTAMQFVALVVILVYPASAIYMVAIVLLLTAVALIDYSMKFFKLMRKK